MSRKGCRVYHSEQKIDILGQYLMPGKDFSDYVIRVKLKFLIWSSHFYHQISWLGLSKASNISVKWYIIICNRESDRRSDNLQLPFSIFWHNEYPVCARFLPGFFRTQWGQNARQIFGRDNPFIISLPAWASPVHL